MTRPRIAVEPSKVNKINPGRTPEKKLWRFSLRYWKQIENFGLDRSKPSWFVSLLEKLAECSKEEIDTFLGDGRKRNSYRFHEINWSQPGIPIQKEELTWIDSQYLENNQEFRFFQLQISTSLGRIIGFFDETGVFNIVLLDPLHNAQPSKSFGYKVNPCSPLQNDFCELLSTVRKVAVKKWCQSTDCQVRSALETVCEGQTDAGVLIVTVGTELFKKVKQAMARESIDTLEEFFEFGVMFFEESAASRSFSTSDSASCSDN